MNSQPITTTERGADHGLVANFTFSLGVCVCVCVLPAERRLASNNYFVLYGPMRCPETCAL